MLSLLNNPTGKKVKQAHISVPEQVGDIYVLKSLIISKNCLTELIKQNLYLQGILQQPEGHFRRIWKSFRFCNERRMTWVTFTWSSVQSPKPKQGVYKVFNSTSPLASHADVLRGSSRVRTRDEPPRTSAWEATSHHVENVFWEESSRTRWIYIFGFSDILCPQTSRDFISKGKTCVQNPK